MQSIFPGYSHFILEDFKTVNQIDLYSAKVTSIITGDDSIDCDPVEGMIPGAWYTISDGVNSELVQAESINYENGIQRVILSDVIANTYILSSTKIYRTSAQISDGAALGASSVRSVMWVPQLIWSGKGENENYIIQSDSSAGNAGAFNMTGNAVLDSESYITLGD